MRKMKRLIYLILFFVCFLTSCIWDRSTDVLVCEQGTEGFDEIILLNGDTMFAKPYPDGTGYWPSRRGKFYSFHEETDSKEPFFVTEDGTIISGHVDDWIHDSVFVLADRKPLDSIFGHCQHVPLPFDSTSFYWGRPKEPNNYNDVWNMLLESPIHDFWIINQNTSDVYGPMSFEQYLAKKKELGVPEKLQLKYEKERLKE